MAKVDFLGQGVTPFGSAYGTKQMILGIPGELTANKGGVIFLEAISAGGAENLGAWLFTDGTNLRYSTGATAPASTNAGTAIGATGASKALSDLASVAINESLISDADNTDDLGSAANQWKDLYINGTAHVDLGELDAANVGRTAGVGADYIKIAASGVLTLEGAATVDGVATGNIGDITANETVTGLWDFTNANGLKTDDIVESGSGSGVTIDNVLLKDYGVTCQGITNTVTAITTSAGIDIGADSVKLRFGTVPASDSYILFDGTHLTFWDSNLGATVTLTDLAGGALTDPTVTGDLTISNGQFAWTDSTDEIAATWSFGGTTNNDINWASAITSGSALQITTSDTVTGDVIHVISSGMTSGTAFKATLTEATLSAGYYFEGVDSGAAQVFTVGEDGVTTITGNTL